MASQEDEYTFLCGFQKIRRYGSTCDLNSPSQGFRKFSQIILHEVQPTDTLQSLELKYNSSMFEIKRINRLWSNDSLHCKTHISIPLFNESRSAVVSPTQFIDPRHDRRVGSPEQSNIQKIRTKTLDPLDEQDTGESAKDFFKRIDSNVKQTKKAVKKLNKKS